MKLSICCITYNHAAFIKQTLDSFISQQVDFVYEIVVCDDHSTDETAQIIRTFQQNFPDRVRAFLRDENIGMMPNFKLALQACQGDYIALCEGDDYWTDTNKLQKQVDFLDANPEYSVCFHRVFEQADGKDELSDFNVGEDRSYNILELAAGNIIHTPSVVFRNHIDSIPDWFEQSPAGDYVLHMHHARRGLIHYMAEPMAVYRRHGQSAWSSQSMKTLYARWIIVLGLLLNEFKSEKAIHARLLDQLIETYEKGCSRATDENDLDYIVDLTAKLMTFGDATINAWLHQVYRLQMQQLVDIPVGIKSSYRHLIKQIRQRFQHDPNT